MCVTTLSNLNVSPIAATIGHIYDYLSSIRLRLCNLAHDQHLRAAWTRLNNSAHNVSSLIRHSSRYGSMYI
jgi:hypothetical protein